MVKSTETAIRAIARADGTITEQQLRAALDALAGKSGLVAMKNPAPLASVLSREDVAELLHKSVKQIDVLCRRGALTRHYTLFPDGTRAKRATGITETSYRAFVAAGGGEVLA